MSSRGPAEGEPRVWWAVGAVALALALTFVVLAGVALAACSGSPGNLVPDRRVRDLEPRPGSTVEGPVTLKWSSTFEPGEASDRWFVVYLDAAPIPPGQSALVAASEPCESVVECLELGAMDGPNVFLTDAHSVEAGRLPGGAGPEHRFTVILVDGQGIRDGDSAWNSRFVVEP